MNDPFRALRQRAEASVKNEHADVSKLSELEIKNLIHNLEVHRIELEMQNDELKAANKEKDAARKRHADLFEFAPAGYVVMDAAFVITQSNKSFSNMVGVEKERLAGAPFTDYIDPDFQDAFHLAARRLRRSRGKTVFEMRLRAGETPGAWVHAEMTAPDAGQSFLVSLIDVNDRKRAEDALKLSEAKFRDLFNVVADPMFIHDPKGNILEVNQSACAKLGYSRAEILNLRIADIDADYSHQDVIDVISELLETGEKLFEGTHKTKEGRRFSVEVHSRTITFEGETALLSLARDVSRRKEAERRYEFLSNMTFEGIIMHKNGVALDMNASCARITGYSRQELIGANLFDLIPDETDKKKARQNMMESRVTPFIIKVRRKDGRLIDAEIQGRSVEYDGAPVRIAAVRDVTEKQKIETALDENRKNLADILENMHDAVYSVDARSFTLLRTNPAIEKIFGRPMQAFYDNPMMYLDMVHPEDYPHVRQSVEDIFRVKQGEWTYRIIRPDGETRWVSDRARLVEDDAGNPLRVDCFFSDVTERKRAETALRERIRELRDLYLKQKAAEDEIREANRRLRELNADLQAQKERAQHYLDIAGVLFIALDRRGIVTLANKKAGEVFGYPEEEIIGKNWVETFIPEDRIEEVDAVFSQIMTGSVKDVEFIENEVLTRTGEVRNIAWHNSVLKNEKNEITGLLSSGEDVTVRKRAEQALKESEEKFRSIVENVNDIIYAVRPDGVFTYVSPNWREMLGHGAEEVIGRSFSEFVHPEDVRLCAEFLEKVLTTGEKQSGVEYRVAHKNGTWRWHFSNGSPIKDAGNRTLSYIGVARDVTERRQAEQDLKNALAEKEILLKEIHHRVKNNMQTIASLLYKQQRHTDDENAKMILEDSIGRVKSMALIHERIYRSQNLARINLSDYLHDFAGKLFKAYAQKSADVSLQIRADDVYLPVDKSIPVALIVNELVTNALKYAFPKHRPGTVRIECAESNGEITLKAGDDGVGLPENISVERARSLGLYLVYNLAVRQLGGRLHINKERGTEFVIRFNAGAS